MIIPYQSDVEIPKPAFFSMGLVIVNVALLVYTTAQTSPLFYFDWGFTPVDHTAVNWVTHMFLHGGFGHLAGNMLFLWIFGPAVEWSLGALFYLPAYLLFGVAAAAINTHLTPVSMKDIPCIGASGAISGLMGAYLVLYPGSRIKHLFLVFIRPIFFSLPAWTVLGLFFLEQAVMSFYVSDFVTVAVGAHLGGFVTGALVGSVFKWVGHSSTATEPPPSRADAAATQKFSDVDARAEYLNLKPMVDRRPDDLPLRHALALAAARAGEVQEALDEARFVMGRYPEHDLKHRFKLRLLLNSLTDRQPKPEEVLELADGFGLIKKYPEHTFALYRRFLENWPNHPRRPGVLLNISTLLVDHFKRPEEAMLLLEEASRGDPRSGLVREANAMLEKISLARTD